MSRISHKIMALAEHTTINGTVVSRQPVNMHVHVYTGANIMR